MGKNNERPVTHVELMQARNMHRKDKMSITAIAKKLRRGQETVKNMVNSKSLSEFRRLQAARVERDSAARKAKRQNQKAQEKAAEKVIEDITEPYTPEQSKILIDGLIRHCNNLEERLQTISSLLVESDDNIVTRLYKLENKKGVVRRFLEKF